MSPTTLNPSRTLADQGRSTQHALRLARSTLGAWCLLAGLPALGLLAALFAALPLFAGLMAGCFLLATALTCQKAIATFTRQALRLLVTARVVLVIVLGGLLCGTAGAPHLAVVSAVVLWLVADRLLGRRALRDLYRAVRGPK
jgi:hypothetical protein